MSQLFSSQAKTKVKRRFDPIPPFCSPLFFTLIIILYLVIPSSIFAENFLGNLGAVFIAHFDESICADKPEGYVFGKHGGKIIDDGISGKALSLGYGEYLTLDVQHLIQAKEGTLMFWVRPHWDYDKSVSHTFVSFTWSDNRNGYFVLSDGWWEPGGAPFTYFIFNNQDYAKVNKLIWYDKNEWMHFCCTWSRGELNLLRLYVNGMLTRRQDNKIYKQLYGSKGKLYLGCDKGTPMGRGRWGDCDIDELNIFCRPLSEEEIFLVFKQQNIKTYSSIRGSHGHIIETRAILDESRNWLTEQGALKTIQKIKKAGFNVYIPCIWHGKGTLYPSIISPPEEGLKFSDIDPLARLISIAHENGIEVHPWVKVARRWRNFLNSYYGPQTPDNAFDIHRPGFRKFMINLVLDVIQRYEVDGINLDYIRTMGICKCEYCVNEYKRIYRRNLLDDSNKHSKLEELEPSLQEWQDQAVKDIVQQISERGKGLKPNLIISVDGHPVSSYFPTNSQGRQEVQWANEGLIDIIFYMDYRKNPSFVSYRVIRKELKNPSALIPLLGNFDRLSNGRAISREAKLLNKLISYSQLLINEGRGIYSLSFLSNKQIKILAEGAFRGKALPHWSKSK